MKIEFVSYLPGGFYRKDDTSDGVYTRMVRTQHYSLMAQPEECGCLAALWAAACVRFDEVFKAEQLVGLYAFPDQLDLGTHKFPVSYDSKLPYLKWWVGQKEVFVDFEMHLQNLPISVYMNVPHGNELIASLQWLVSSANCQPAGLTYEIADLEKKQEPKDGDEGLPVQAKRASPSDIRAIKANQALMGGKLSISQLQQAFNLKDGPELVKATAVVGSDGFLQSHRELLNRFREHLAPLAGRLPYLESKYISVTDLELGVSLADLYASTMRVSFPDLFGAQRALEEIAAEEARRARETKKK